MATTWLKNLMTATLATTMFVAAGCSADPGSTASEGEKATPQSSSNTEQITPLICPCSGTYSCPTTGVSYAYLDGACHGRPTALAKCNQACAAACIDDNNEECGSP